MDHLALLLPAGREASGSPGPFLDKFWCQNIYIMNVRNIGMIESPLGTLCFITDWALGPMTFIDLSVAGSVMSAGLCPCLLVAMSAISTHSRTRGAPILTTAIQLVWEMRSSLSAWSDTMVLAVGKQLTKHAFEFWVVLGWLFTSAPSLVIPG